MRFPAGITCFLGKRGRGKSLHLAYYAVERLKRGMEVYSNMPITYKHKGRTLQAHYIDSEEEFLKVFWEKTNCLVIFDEAGTMLPREKWRSLPMWVKKKFRESRKDRIDIYYSAQTMRQVVKDLVELTEEAALCVRVPLFGFLWAVPKVNWKGVRRYFYKKHWKHIPRLLRNKAKFSGTKEAAYHDKAWSNYKKFVKATFIKWVPTWSTKAYYSDPYNYMGTRQIYGKKWWESLWRTDFLRPRQWLPAAKAYDTRFKPDSRYKPHFRKTPQRENPDEGLNDFSVKDQNKYNTSSQYRNTREKSSNAFHDMRN